MTTKPLAASVRLPKIHLDKTLVARLEALAASVMRRSPEVGERLIDEIARAKLVAADKLPDDVVTIGSMVTYRDMASSKLQTVSGAIWRMRTSIAAASLSARRSEWH